jgi:hypothetical protein
VLLSRPVQASHFCITPSFGKAGAQAEQVFSGKITKVERETNPDTPGEYIVTFKVETSWKGTPASETRVVWRSIPFIDCPTLPVGEVGDDYLVYADPSIRIRGEKLAEVTFFNRTARQLPSRKAELIVKNGFTRTVIDSDPPLNRSDASNDVEMLLAMRACGCLSTNSQQGAAIEASAEATQRASECMACMQRRLKPFW